MMRYDPFREIEELQQRMDRAFGQGRMSGVGASYAPSVDIHEDEQGLEIVLDLPGIDPNDIRVEAENSTLSVQAERRARVQQGGRSHRTERLHGTFVRTFNMPNRYDLGRIQANYEHGTLTLRVPTAEQAMRRSIPVQMSQGSGPRTLDQQPDEQAQSSQTQSGQTQSSQMQDGQGQQAQLQPEAQVQSEAQMQPEAQPS